MKVCVVVFALIVAASAQRGYVDDYPSAPIPYSFNYVAPGEEGQSSHQETSDGNGKVTGTYSLQDVDGRHRIVEYIADENGFRATIRTNEPGTANQNPADVTIESTADQGAGAGAVAPPQQPRSRPVARPAPAPSAYQPGLAVGSPEPGYVLVPIDAARRIGY